MSARHRAVSGRDSLEPLRRDPGHPTDPARPPEHPEPPEHPVVAKLSQKGTLGSQVRRGVAWTAATQVVLLVVQIAGSAALGRLLLPDDFGLVAIVFVLNRLAALVSGLGLATAVVQARRVTERLLSTAFWLNATVGVAVTLLLVAAAPLVAAAYDRPDLTGLIRVAALAFSVSIAVVPLALLQRTLHFKRAATFEVVASVVGLGTSVALAAAGVGAHSLVIGPVVQAVVLNVMAFAAVGWVPRALAHRREMGQLWRFGRGLTGANLLYFASRNADTALLGFTVSDAQLGLYNRAYNLMLLPLTQVTNTLSRVVLPAYSQLQDELPRLRAAWITTVRTSLVFGLPAGLGLAATAPAALGTLYGPNWVGASTALTLLAASLPPQLIARNFGPLYQALGRTGLQFRVAVVGSVITISGAAVGLRWGIDGVAAALLVTSGLSMLVGLTPLMRMIHASVGQLWRAVRGLLLAGVAMAGAAYGSGQVLPDLPAIVVLAVQVAVGGVVYVGVLALVERGMVRSALARVRRRG